MRGQPHIKFNLQCRPRCTVRTPILQVVCIGASYVMNAFKGITSTKELRPERQLEFKPQHH